MGILGVAGPPLAVVCGLLGIGRDAAKGRAIAGLLLGGLTCGLWGLLFLCF